MKMFLKLLIIAAIVLPLSGVTAKAQSTKAQIEALKLRISSRLSSSNNR